MPKRWLVLSVSKNTVLVIETTRGFGLAFTFPIRQMGFEPFIMVFFLCFLIMWVPKQEGL